MTNTQDPNRTEQWTRRTEFDLRRAVEMWENGEATSPSSDDFVALAEHITHGSLSEADREAFYQYQCEGHGLREQAEWLVSRLALVR
jgi:hypothetical protein